MTTYTQLIGVGVSTRQAALFTGIPRASAARANYGLADMIDRDRDAALEAARRAHPERFGSRAQARPKFLDRDPTAWINQPPADELLLAA